MAPNVPVTRQGNADLFGGIVGRKPDPRHDFRARDDVAAACPNFFTDRERRRHKAGAVMDACAWLAFRTRVRHGQRRCHTMFGANDRALAAAP